jgi:aspartyl-tRNA synthetase
MIVSEQSSIHEVIAFPKNTVGVCSMDDSPSPVDDAQLAMDNIAVRMPPEKEK